jgi:tungstate transport system substrate-binding protein
VNPEKHSHVRNTQAQELEGWLVSDRARQMINTYTIGGEALFTFNARY